MILCLPYPPSANRYWRNWRGRTVKSAEARAYQAKVKLLALAQHGPYKPLTGDVSVIVSVYRPMKIGDLDNTLKVTLDALKGIAYVDDEQIVELVATRRDDKGNPRAVVTVTGVAPVAATNGSGSTNGPKSGRGAVSGVVSHREAK